MIKYEVNAVGIIKHTKHTLLSDAVNLLITVETQVNVWCYRKAGAINLLIEQYI